MNIQVGLVELIIRALCDVKPESIADGAFLFGQTKDNQSSVLLAAQHIISNNLAKRILIIKTEKKSGYPGFTAWEKELLKLGIQKNKIVGVDMKKTNSLNTLIEAEALINYAKRKNYRSLYVVASSFHQLRGVYDLSYGSDKKLSRPPYLWLYGQIATLVRQCCSFTRNNIRN